MNKLRFCLVYFSLLVLVLGAAAQVQNGKFTGTVADPSSAAIANAKVTVTNMGTNLSVTTTTNETGLYTIKELPIGTYRITAEAKGFKTSVNANVALNAGTVARVDFRMELGQAREVVEVSGEAAAVNTEDSKLASTVTSTQIANLPLNGRNVYDLMQMAPGAVNVQGTDFENGHGTVVNGLREDFNGFLDQRRLQQGSERRSHQHPDSGHGAGISAVAVEHVGAIRKQRRRHQQPGDEIRHQLLPRQPFGSISAMTHWMRTSIS